MAYLWKILVFLLFLQNFALSYSKAIWVVRDALTSKETISEIVERTKLLNCDKIFLQLRALGTAYYPTKLDIPHKEINPALLKDLFNQAVASNIEVHIWLNVCYVWPIKKRPETQNHVLNKVSASIITPVDPSVKPEGYYLHPNDKWNLSEIKTMMDELLGLYPVAGFHLDYFRYPKEKIHTSKLGRTEFLIKYGLDPLMPLTNAEKFTKERGFGAYSYFQEKYRDFLRDELTLALSEIRTFLKGINKDVKLSIAVKPNPIGAKHHFLQDWAFWLEKDLCDFVVLMNYNPEMKTFVNNINITSQKVNTAKVMIGIATYNIEAEEIFKRIEYVKSTSYSGYVLFSYNYINNRKKLFDLLRN